MTVNVWAFLAVAVPLVATPGVSTAVVLRNSIADGVRSGAATAIGANAASVAYGLFTAFGVSDTLQRWPVVWLALQYAGIAYLAWLGLRSLARAAARDVPETGGWAGRGVVRGERAPLVRHAREGFLANALNPSVATFYLLVVPQFIPRGAPFARGALLLTAIHVGLAVSWHLAWATAGGTLAAVLGRSRPRRLLDGLSGLALIGLAVKIAHG